MFSFLNLNICICRRWIGVRGSDQLRARCPVSSPVRPLRISVALCFKKSSAVVIGIHHIIIKTLRLQVFFLVFCFVFVNIICFKSCSWSFFWYQFSFWIFACIFSIQGLKGNTSHILQSESCKNIGTKVYTQ